jgi:hypothetical protein
MQFALHACGACLPASCAVHLALAALLLHPLSAPHPAAYILFFYHQWVARASARRVTCRVLPILLALTAPRARLSNAWVKCESRSRFSLLAAARG